MIQQQGKSPKRSHIFLLRLGLAIGLLILVIVIGINFVKKQKLKEIISNLPEPRNPVTVMTVTAKEWTPVIETTGLVRPNQGAMLSAQSPGMIKQVLVTSGQQVKKGDVLVELDNSVELANLQATEAQLPAAHLAYQRYAKLIKSQSVSQTELDKAKATYDQLVANINALKSAIERRKIVAPFDGVTGIVQVNEGQFISAGTPIVRVEDQSVMKVDFSIAQTQLEQLFVGQKITATSDARLGQTFAAKVTAIEPAINPATGLIDVQATFEPEVSHKLLSGMFTRLRLALPTEHNQVVIPQVGVSYNMYGEFSYVLQPLSEQDKQKMASDPNLDKLFRVKQVTVFTKDRQGIYAQLKGNDIKVGDQIVTGGMQRLSNGSLVIIKDQQAVGTSQPAKNSNL